VITTKTRTTATLGSATLLLLGAMAFFHPGSARAEPRETFLSIGEALEREIASGETHAYRVAGEGPLRLIVEQRGVDVEIVVEPPRGESLVFDGPFDRRGRETALLEGAAHRRFTIRGREAGAPRGVYVVRLAAVEALAASRAASTASRLYPVGTTVAWRQAAGHYLQAFERWRELGEEAEAALALYARAVLLRLIDEPREALGAASEALETFRALGNSVLEAYALNEIGLGHWHLGDLEAARRAFERSSALHTGHEDVLVAAATASNLCLLDLSRGELETARECYTKALPTIERARAAQIESAARTNLGRIAENLGEPDEALEHYRRALAALAVTGDRRATARTLTNLGVLLRGMGDLDTAMARYAEALEIFEELGDQRWQARVLSNIGYAYRWLGDPARARTSFERALELAREAEDRRSEATNLDNLGLVELELGHPANALEHHRKALELRRGQRDRRAEAVTLRRLGEAHAELGQESQALAHLGEAKALSAELGDRQGEAATRRRLGQILLEEGELEAARRELEAALDLASDAGQRSSAAEILYELARVEVADGRPAEARRRVTAALERFEGLRDRIESPELRTSFAGFLRGAYELEVGLLMAAHRAEPEAGHDLRALEVAERARARTLLELLQEADVELTRGVDPALLERRRELTRRLDAKTERLADPQLAPGRREALAAEQVALLQRLEVLDGEIRRESPAYDEIVRPRSLEAAEIGALVDPGTALAIYFLAEPRSYLWRVSSEEARAFELPGRSEIEAGARCLYDLWSELDPGARAADYEAAAGLGEKLRLNELRGFRRLAILADGALHVIPFAALPLPPETAGGIPEPLVEHTEVVSLPSASVLALDRRHHGESAPGRSVAILADPVFGADYPSLPASRLEAEAIAEVAGPGKSLVALGFEAERGLVESGRLADYPVVHFATHGVIDTETPALSGLVLSQVDSEGRPQPGFLRLHEIFNLRFDAELVVLSGCRTAHGRVVRGEGLIGLARGFMYAGARRVVASSWQVEDRATAELMTRFYQALWRDGLPPSAALARAQRELSRERRFRDPYHWAGFILVGDWR